MTVDLCCLAVGGALGSELLLDGNLLIGRTERLTHREEARVRYELGFRVQLEAEAGSIRKVDDAVDWQWLVCKQVTERRVDRLSIG